MTQDANIPNNDQDQNDDLAPQPQPADPKAENTVPSYRLKEEADKRRAAETKVAEYEKKEQERNDVDLNWKEKHDKVATEFTQFKETAARDTLNGEFTSKMIEAGLPSKIAKVAIPTDLSIDNMGGKIKEAVKEFAEFIPKVDDAQPNTSFSSVQPGNTIDPRADAKGVGELARLAAGKKS